YDQWSPDSTARRGDSSGRRRTEIWRHPDSGKTGRVADHVQPIRGEYDGSHQSPGNSAGGNEAGAPARRNPAFRSFTSSGHFHRSFSGQHSSFPLAGRGVGFHRAAPVSGKLPHGIHFAYGHSPFASHGDPGHAENGADTEHDHVGRFGHSRW